MKTVKLNKTLRIKGGKGFEYVGPGDTPLADDVADWAVKNGHGEAAKVEKPAKAEKPKQDGEAAKAEK